QYGHISLIFGTDGSPLSKRNGSRSVQDLREQGFLPTAVVNYLARLGHYYKDDSFMSLDNLSKQFATVHLSKSPARFDESQLLHWQKEAIQHAEHDDLWEWMRTHVKEHVALERSSDFVETVKANIIFPEDAKTWAQAIFSEQLELSHESKEIIKQAGMEFFEQTLEGLSNFGTDFKEVTNHVKQQTGAKGKGLFMPLRIALTGEQHGPEMVKILPLMGVEKAKQRIEAAIYSI
ncbi:unnamed protein product, partial [marine sediment metagenome]